jgi:NADH-quinone oxidoreductase subunit N
VNLDLSTYGGLTLALLPELVLTGWAMVLLLVVAWRHRTPGDLRVAGWIALAAVVTTAGAVFWLWWHTARATDPAAMIAVDDFRFISDWLFLGAAGLTVLLSFEYLEREGLLVPEYYVLLLLGTAGMMLMAGGADLIVIFLGLELMSVAVYVLAAVDRKSPRGAEAGLKYFLLGAFASGFLLYGIALIFGATGTTNLRLMALQIGLLDLAGHPLLLAGTGLLLIGFGFKVAAVPFHQWAPDVYDGSPTPVAGYMATAVKAAAFAALFRVLGEGLAQGGLWREVVYWLAIATMVAGNFTALAQRSLKRMLAYSSVAHAGYLLAAVATGSPAGAAAFIFYLVAYTLMTLGAFAVLAAKGRRGESDVLIDDLAGLNARRPWLAFLMALCMLSLLGFPPTAGFFGKWYVLAATVEAGQGLLATIVVLTSVVSAGYYLPVIMAMYMRPEPGPDAHVGVQVGGLARAALAAAAAGLIGFGLLPSGLLDLSRQGGSAIHSGATAARTAPAAAAPAPPPAAR